jgi:hypothetical protein
MPGPERHRLRKASITVLLQRATNYGRCCHSWQTPVPDEMGVPSGAVGDKTLLLLAIRQSTSSDRGTGRVTDQYATVR